MAKRESPTRARMSDESVCAKTGKTWAEWFSVLDRAGAAALKHGEIAAYLRGEHRLADWWCPDGDGRLRAGEGPAAEA
jgi:hypothetical protein